VWVALKLQQTTQIKGRVKKLLNVQRHMSLPRPNENLIW
jgi:hypothetical protein